MPDGQIFGRYILGCWKTFPQNWYS